MSESHAPTNYVKIWAILLVLLVISVLGPEIGIQWVTMVTAFGIAIVKAYLVIKYFMHLTVEPKYVIYLLVAMLGFSALFVAGVSPDVMKHEGQHWENVAAKAHIERKLAEAEAAGADHGHEHGADSHQH